MTNSAAVLAALLALPRYTFDPPESETDRAARLGVVADAIASASRTRTEEASLVAIVKHESAGSMLVQLGRCAELPRGQRCDGGAARGLFQLHRAACPAAYALPEGSVESIRAEAQCAIRLLRWNAQRGKEHTLTPLRAAFAGYAARDWHWKGAEERERTVRAVLARMEGRP